MYDGFAAKGSDKYASVEENANSQPHLFGIAATAPHLGYGEVDLVNGKPRNT